MKKIIILCLICFALSNEGPDANEKNPSSIIVFFFYGNADSISESFDYNLYHNTEKKMTKDNMLKFIKLIVCISSTLNSYFLQVFYCITFLKIII